MAEPLLTRLADRHGRQQRRATAIRGSVLVLLAGAWGYLLQGPMLGLIGAAVAATVSLVLRRRPLDRREVARRLEDVIPELEDSVSLLLREPQTRLERAQQARLSERAALLDSTQDLARLLPAHRHRWLDAAIIAMALAVAGTALLQALLDEPWFEVHVQPPVYTGLSPFATDELTLSVPQGSIVTWRADRPRQELAWIGDDGETPFNGSELQLQIMQDTLYRLAWGPQDARETTLPATLAVEHDRPPRLVLEQPESSPVLFSGPDQTLAFMLTASDDHGLGPAELSVTVASGQGEGVRFRDRSLPLEPLGDDREARYLAQIDPTTLEMAPGDELYVRAIVHDNRAPEPQQTRSPAVIFRWVNPEEAGEMAMGMPVDRMPEYFRSQRQIIIDTEKLLEEASGLSDEHFRERSEALAFDQRSLRFRYGQYLGEEVATDDGGGMAGEHEHEDGAEPSEDDLLESFGHTHDTAENATLFDDHTRATLKGALNAMWQAELQLALSEPATALPHEYEALRQLKAVQHAARIYVKRVGFDPPPLSEEKRLTGDYNEAQSSWLPARAEATDEDDERRRLLAALASDQHLDATARQALDRLAADPTVDLSVRSDAATLAAQPDCSECRDRLVAGLLAALPPPPTQPRRRPVPMGPQP